MNLELVMGWVVLALLLGPLLIAGVLWLIRPLLPNSRSVLEEEQG